MKRPAIGDGGGRCRAYGDNLEGAYPIEEELGLQNGGRGDFLGTLADGCSRVVDPRPTADGERRRPAEGAHDGGVAAVETRYVNGVKFPDGAVDALLACSGKVDVSQLVAVETLMFTNAWRVQDGQEKARKADHVYFVGGKRGGGADGVVIGALDVREL